MNGILIAGFVAIDLARATFPISIVPALREMGYKIDAAIGKTAENIDSDTTLIFLSDHGFCALQQEVYINHWLKGEGFLNFKMTLPKSLSDT